VKIRSTLHLHPRSARPWALICALAGGLGLAQVSLAQTQAIAEGNRISSEVQAQALQLATQAAQALAPPKARVVTLAGALDSRLNLTPCARVQAFLPAGVPPWGRSRVGLRCVQGPAAWQIYLPLTVQVWAPAPVAQVELPAGAQLDTAQLGVAVVDWAASSTPPVATVTELQGRQLSRPVAAGQPLRQADLKARQWFAQGDTVRIVAHSAGFSISTEGQAMGPGVEGQSVRVRTESGRTLVGQPVGERRVELSL
jgi:flagella basal body P-ring formation protein FlgA